MTTPIAVELQTLDHHLPPPKAVLPDIQDYGRPLSSTRSPSPIALQEEAATPRLSKTRAWIVIIQLCGINFISSFSNGLLTVALPAITATLGLPDNLLLWPTSVFYLTSGSCLLIAGSIADVVGPRRVFLPGCFMTAVFILVCGFARTGIELIMFRAMQGIATATIIPSAVSIVAANIEEGTPRNIGFASIWLSMPLGFSLGLVLGGVFVSGPGWRAAYYFGGATGFLSFLIGLWALPRDFELPPIKTVVRRVGGEIDWVGAVLATASIALLSYVLAMLSADTAHITKPANITLLIISLLLIPAFAFWVRRQEQLGKPALIPNSLWKNLSFTSVCLMMLLSSAVVNCLELYSSLYFQEVQQLSAIQASIRILPSVLTGALLNLLAGVFVNKVPVMASILVSSLQQQPWSLSQMHLPSFPPVSPPEPHFSTVNAIYITRIDCSTYCCTTATSFFSIGLWSTFLQVAMLRVVE
ncbi:MFS-type transporter 1 [Pseudocercospora fuligena]|uniref:MFS-type transporter 1 n=1 Tax=Pseudocercospora fuligena TaxID=685502 RepID=A0A8H6VKW5_9PEZI|nr:MFS-type transporter 1 [Pseudocercospora fuligena]